MDFFLVVMIMMMKMIMIIRTCPHWTHWNSTTSTIVNTSTFVSPSSVSSMATTLGFILFRWKVPHLYLFMVCFLFLTRILHRSRSARCLSSLLCSNEYLSRDCDCLLRIRMYFVTSFRFLFAYVNYLKFCQWTNTSTRGGRVEVNDERHKSASLSSLEFFL